MTNKKTKYFADKLQEVTKDYEVIWPSVIDTIENIDR
jgi:hypothetical protein